MTDRIRQLVKRISETRPVQSVRRQALLSELRALRSDLDAHSAPDQAHSLDAALLLMEFMSRSEDVATAETLQIVASLVGTIEERSVRSTPARAGLAPPLPAGGDVAQHQDLRLTHEFLLGSILLQAGVISPESLSRALQLHASSRMALGQCLVQLGAASPDQIAGAVAYQDRLREEERTRAEPHHQVHETHHPHHGPAHAQPAGSTRGDLRLSGKQRGFVQSMHSQVLGEVLIRLGSVTREELERALHLQRAGNLHIGAALVESGAVTWEQIKKALEVQRQLRRAA